MIYAIAALYGVVGVMLYRLIRMEIEMTRFNAVVEALVRDADGIDAKLKADAGKIAEIDAATSTLEGVHARLNGLLGDASVPAPAPASAPASDDSVPPAPVFAPIHISDDGTIAPQ